MKITIHARLQPHSQIILYGGKNLQIGWIKVEREIDRPTILALVTGRISLPAPCDSVIARIKRYVPKTNTLEVDVQMSDVTEEYLNRLRTQGWRLDEAALKHHRLPRSESIQNR
jgi:hypothetical protein